MKKMGKSVCVQSHPTGRSFMPPPGEEGNMKFISKQVGEKGYSGQDLPPLKPAEARGQAEPLDDRHDERGGPPGGAHIEEGMETPVVATPPGSGSMVSAPAMPA